jgi:hypothetical protein
MPFLSPLRLPSNRGNVRPTTNLWDPITLSILRCLYKYRSFSLYWDLSWGTTDKYVKLFRHNLPCCTVQHFSLRCLLHICLTPTVCETRSFSTSARQETFQSFCTTRHGIPPITSSVSGQFIWILWSGLLKNVEIKFLHSRLGEINSWNVLEKLHVWDSLGESVYIEDTELGESEDKWDIKGKKRFKRLWLDSTVTKATNFVFCKAGSFFASCVPESADQKSLSPAPRVTDFLCENPNLPTQMKTLLSKCTYATLANFRTTRRKWFICCCPSRTRLG